MLRFRVLLLALGLVAATSGAGLVIASIERREEQDRSLAQIAADRTAMLEEYNHRARAVSQLAARNTAFTSFYTAFTSNYDSPRSGPAAAQLLDQVNQALAYLERLFPDSIGEACLIDRSGAELARVVRGTAALPEQLSPDESGVPFFRPALAQPPGAVFQSAPYVSPDTGEWVIATVTKVAAADGSEPALVHFEVTVDSFRSNFAHLANHEVVRIVDRRTGAVVVDSRFAQQAGGRLGSPHDKSLRWVRSALDGASRTSGGIRQVVRIPVEDPGNANHWAIVVSAPRPPHPWTGYGFAPLLLLLLAAALLPVAAIGQVRASRVLHRQSRTDELSGLPNRLAIREHAERMFAGARPMAMLLLDLDRFKQINDTLGHAAGDDLLRIVGERLRESLRESGDLAGRLSGDEFVVIAAGVETPSAAIDLADRLLEVISTPVRLETVEVTPSASVGIALAPRDGTSFRALMQNADLAMYDAKRTHARRRVYQPTLSAMRSVDLGLESDLRRAVHGGELELHYQHSVDAPSGRVVAVEALVRWRHPERGLLMPGHFIPLAEASGAIRALTGWVLGTALDDVARWRVRQPQLRVAVNVSVHDICDPDFLLVVQAALAARHLPGNALRLEVTETALLADADVAVGVLQRLSEGGVQIAIDDFGTGYSSLPYLRRFPAAILKLDRSLVLNVTDDDQDAAIVAWTIGMAHSLGMRVVAEGVEDSGMLEALIALGCDELQGYLLHRPVPAADVVLDEPVGT